MPTTKSRLRSIKQEGGAHNTDLKRTETALSHGSAA